MWDLDGTGMFDNILLHYFRGALESGYYLWLSLQKSLLKKDLSELSVGDWLLVKSFLCPSKPQELQLQSLSPGKIRAFMRTKGHQN